MMEQEIGCKAVFQALPGAAALLTLQLVYADVNETWLRLLGRTREQEIGRYMPDDFADRPNHPDVALLRNVVASLRRVAETGERETMELQRFDPPDPGRPVGGDERYWSLTNIPLFGPDGRVAMLLHRVEEVTELIRAREVALSLQEAMLPAPRP
ncbi:PAS domain-containing protein, partial [Streptomyces sp. NPDC001984]